ncbi:MAG: hypothetical protein QG657_5793 [Acidobacteriota bacterium]|nr:hypothetical protein [Acidobacteriota bacterium]
MNQKKETTWLTGGIPGPAVTRDGAIGKGNVIVLTGDDGEIFRSPDGGKNWTAINSGLGDWFHLFGVATDGKGRFVAVGRGRVILMSADNGVTWTIVQTRSADSSIYKVAFGKNNLVIAADEIVGYHVSRDGGATWMHNQDKKIRALRAINYMKDTFYAGTPNSVWRTTNGTTWNQVNTQSGGARAFAYNEKTNTLFAGAHAISRSTDGGNTWEKVFDLKPIYGEEANIMGIACFDDFVICSGGDMLTMISKDNGKTWGQFGRYPAKGGFLSMMQTVDRIIGIGTFAKQSAPVCFLEKANFGEISLVAPTPIPTVTIPTIPTIPTVPTIPTMPTIPTIPTLPTIPTETIPTIPTLPTLPTETIPTVPTIPTIPTVPIVEPEKLTTVLADELDNIAGSLSRIASFLRGL